MILNPGEIFTIARELADPNDSGTYYVQAIVRNARTKALLATVNLTDDGGQRFTKTYQVPQDPVGLGFYISISTRVYTDSGYSTLSDSYSQETDTFLVDNRFRQLGGGGVGGSDVDYKKIKKIVTEAVGEKEDAEPTDLTPITTSIATWAKSIAALLKKTQDTVQRVEAEIDSQGAVIDGIARKPEVDLTPVLDAIQTIPEAPKVDFDPVLAAISGLHDSLDTSGFDKLTKAAGELVKVLQSEDLKKAVAQIPEFATKTGEIESQLKDFLYILETKGAKPAEPAPEKPDYSAMAGGLIGQSKKRA